MCPIYQSVEINPAFEAFFDSEEALGNFCNAAIPLRNEQKIISLQYEKCDREKMLQGNPIDFFFSIDALLNDESKLRIALHKKSTYSLVDEQVITNELAKRQTPYKITCGPGDLYINYPKDYDCVIWISFASDECKRVWSDEESEKMWNEWHRPYRKTKSTRYVCYEINNFSKEISQLESDEDRWLFLLRNTPRAEEAYSLGISAFDNALKRISSSEVLLKFALRQQNEAFFQSEFLYEKECARKRGRAQGCYECALRSLGLPESAQKEDLSEKDRLCVALFMLEHEIDPFYVARLTDLSDSNVAELQKNLLKHLSK